MPFSASIIERSFAYVPDKILKLGGAAWVRTMGGPVSSSTYWERIRIGVLCAAPNSAVSLYDILFTIGLCSGPGAAAYSTANYIGVSMIGAAATGSTRVLTYNAGSGNPYFTATAGQGFRKRYADIVDTTANFSSGLPLPISTQGYYWRRVPIILDITKLGTGGSGAVALAVYYNTTAADIQATDFRPDHLLEAIDQPGTPVVRGVTLNQVLNVSTLDYSPVGGEASTVEIFWSSIQYPLEISAVGASVLRTLAYQGADVAGIADDSMESYTVSSTPIPDAGFIDGGSGWSSTGTVGHDPVTTTGNFLPQVYGEYVGTTNSPDEPFEQYVNGSVITGVTVNLGTYWATPAVIYYDPTYPGGTNSWSGNLAPQTAYAGTTNSPDDPLQQYATGTVNSGTTVNLGTYWTAPLHVEAFAANNAPIAWGYQAGTAYSDYDLFESYATNSDSDPYTTVLNGGSWWPSYGTIYSTGSGIWAGTTVANLVPFIGTNNLAGTVYNTYDTFESYGTGTVVSGVTLNSGSFWASYGSITTFTYP